uniref:Kinesin motor domain-containing protein n=1 Tax=Heterorhabditis bacteriophora TaxID=37862 RepID=A0A1I7X0J3_HETBA
MTIPDTRSREVFVTYDQVTNNVFYDNMVSGTGGKLPLL